MIDPRDYNPPKVEQLHVIRVTVNFGKGVEGDPVRNIECYYDAADSRLLFVVDQFLIDQERRKKAEGT